MALANSVPQPNQEIIDQYRQEHPFATLSSIPIVDDKMTADQKLDQARKFGFDNYDDYVSYETSLKELRDTNAAKRGAERSEELVETAPIYSAPGIKGFVEDIKENNKQKANDLAFTNNTPEDKLWSQLTQREQFNQTMFDDDGNLTDFGQAIVDAYGADYGNRDDAYEKWRGSNNRDLTAALFGYGEEGDNQGIRGWQQLAQRSGVNNLDEMMDYMWGDQAFNIYDYLTNDQYANASALGYSDDAMAALASYIASDPEIGMYIPEDVMGANNEQIAKYFNSPDFAEYALANEMAREASANEGKINLSRYDLDRINDILGQAGEGYMLGAVDENNGFEKKESQNPRNYSMPGLLNGRAGLRPYAGSGDTSNLDSDELDTILAALNASDAGKGKEIGIKGR